MGLALEVNEACKADWVERVGNRLVLMTPKIGEDYWRFRVKLGDKGQAMLGFPKFLTIGIGFARETDWNTNLPYTRPAAEIWRHIQHNKGDDSISDEDCIRAIEIIQAAVALRTGERSHER